MAQKTVLYLATLYLEASSKWLSRTGPGTSIFVNQLEGVLQHNLLKSGYETKQPESAGLLLQRPRQAEGMGR